MKLVALLLATLFLALPVSAGCGLDPQLSTFSLGATCQGGPCLAGQPVRFTVAAERSCYPPYVPCAPFPFELCDIVEWNFDDGTTATTQGTGTVTHTFATGGLYTVYATVKNSQGEKEAGRFTTIAMTPPAYVKFSAEQYTVNEQDGSVTLTIERAGELDRDIPLSFSTGGWGEGYIGNLEIRNVDLVLLAGHSAMDVTLAVKNDEVFQGEAQHFVSVSCLTGQAILEYESVLSSTEVRIIDDEPGPVVTVGDLTVVEGETRVVEIPLQLSQALTQDVVIFWTHVDGTAVRDSDYTSLHGYYSYENTTIPAGRTTAAIKVKILGDDVIEDDETFRLDFDGSGVSGAHVMLSQPFVTITIKDDDAYGLSGAGPFVQAGQSMPMTLTMKDARPAQVQVPLESTNPSVIAVPPALLIPPGLTQVTFDAQALAAGAATIRAFIPGGPVLTADVTSGLRSTLAVSQSALQLAIGERYTLRFDVQPAPEGGATVQLLPTRQGIVSVPRSVTIDAQGHGQAEVVALAAGATSIAALLPESLGGEQRLINVDVARGAAPAIRSLSPSTGSIAGGTRVTIDGSGFTSSCRVTFGGAAATSTLEGGRLVAIAPAHAAGSVDVVVQCGSVGEARRVDGFHYIVPRRRGL